MQARIKGPSRSVGKVVPGINAMAASVFDHTGAIVLCLGGCRLIPEIPTAHGRER